MNKYKKINVNFKNKKKKKIQKYWLFFFGTIHKKNCMMMSEAAYPNYEKNKEKFKIKSHRKDTI